MNSTSERSGGQPANALDLLARDGFCIQDPEWNDGDAVHQKLWQLIHKLADLHIYLNNTDHLSDRELFTHLKDEFLTDPFVDGHLPGANSFLHIDLIGHGSEKDLTYFLKYYADEDERREISEEYPDLVLPEPAKHPHNRDKSLPQPTLEAPEDP